MNMIPVEKTTRSIALKALDEANNILRINVFDDEFIRSAISDLQKLSASNQISEDVYKRVSVLGLASVRVYQSFDEIPETDKFVGLCNDLSKAITAAR